MSWAQDLRKIGAEGAPGYVETRLRAAFRQHYRPRRWTWLPLAAALASVVATIALWTPGPVEVAPPPILRASAAPPDLAFQKAPAAVRQSAIRNRQSAMEVATDFFPLQYVADARVWSGGTLVRVSVPRAAMSTFGFPVELERRQERIEADVLLGGDGMARAVRFVQPRPGFGIR